MDKKPHSRNKTISSGSANVAKGGKIQTGGRPVGGRSGRSVTSNSGSHSGGSGFSGIGGSSPHSGGNRAPYSGNGQQFSGGQSNSANRSFVPTSSYASAGKRSRSSGCLMRIVVLILAFVILSSLLRTCEKGFGDSSLLFGSIPSISQNSGSSSSGGFSLDDLNDYGSAGSNSSQESSSGSSVNLNVAAGARDKRVVPVGDGKDVVTVMVYMCGTDLESQSGMATKDLQEMLSASVSDKVNVIIQTGGCKRWRNDLISNSVNQIYKVINGKLQQLEGSFGSGSMTNPDTLSEFISYCKDNYPADRNFLILWDHGGGSISGYGYDEKYTAKSSMTLDKLNQALSDAGCIFDCIGFDACLMATFENALVCNQYADYLLASEETEPGTGWYYTNWLTQLSKNTSIPTLSLAQTIIDDFVTASTRSSYNSRVSLSLIDLAEMQGTVPTLFKEFSVSTSELIENDEYKTVSNARAKTRQFSQSSRINQVDLIDLAKRIGTSEGKDLVKALASCIKYNKTNISDANGISIYFPYESLGSINKALEMYKTLGIDEAYTECIKSFASIESAGQYTAYSAQPNSYLGSSSGSSYGSSYGSNDFLEALLNAYAGNTYGGSGSSHGSYPNSYYASSYGNSYGSTNSISSPLDALFGTYSNSSGSVSSGNSIDLTDVLGLLSNFKQRSMPRDLSWVDTELVASYAENISNNFIDPGRICITEKDGVKVLSLTEEEWELIQSVELNVFADDGNGYIDLGLDNTFEWYNDSDLLVDYDGTWITVNGNVAAYYMVSDTEDAYGSWTTIGRIPAVLNSQLVELQVVFDDDNPAGVITGAFPLYHNETDTIAKGDIEIREGDTLQFVCDYYRYNGEYSDSYLLGKPFTVGAKGLKLTNMTLRGIGSCSVTYKLTDIYGNDYWTPAFEYYVG